MRSNSSNNKIVYKLNDEEKLLLGYDFSMDKKFITLVEYRTKFNEIYRDFLNIFRRIFMKKSRANIKNDLEKMIKELGEKEQDILLKYKIIYNYLALSQLNINTTDILLEFNSNEEKEAFIKRLIERKELMKKFNEQIQDLEYKKNRINHIYDKVITNSCFDVSNK